MATKQYLLRLDEKLIEELNQAAAEFGEDSGNQVAAVIIKRYLKLWRAAKAGEQSIYEEQISQALGKAPTAEPETRSRSTPSRRKKAG